MSGLSRRLFLAAAATAMATRTTAQEADGPAAAPGLRVIFCGTSGPLPVRGRAKACVAIQAGAALYLVDVGPEATENLVAWRLPLAAARAVFLTHLHSDHIGEVGEFNMQSWVAGRPRPLSLVGPQGTEAVARGFNLAYGPDHGFRHAHHDHGAVRLPLPAGLLAPVTLKAAGPGPATQVAWREDGLVVTAIRVAHDPVSPAFGYRFDRGGRSVVISGDTRKWPPLAQASRSADVLIHEAQNAAMTRQMSAGLAAQGNARMSSIMADTLSYHTTPVEAAEIARDAGVRQLVLYHLTQAGLPMFSPEAFMRGMAAVGGPPARLASDGMTIDLPANSDEIGFGQLPIP